ncbi:type IV pilin N-terminal domain-containing protein [Methanoplanus limicola]|uniref:Flagellin domain protein n=1 Tax=Methanoplanus limicola DSM 2279 TaxID=937775 RepID=H1Z241_9EURY|nr:type IV pilin N-terminal domain-containing protein [Methanoplanus limicola]EHQ36386.1 flagellin domain protein [Methanoplanus limicola DSM 2279]
MKEYGYKNEEAVSPVVGVMLMLVVTIIIAAVVSAYAGGIGSTQQMAPQAAIAVEYSVADGMTMYHNGGDTLTVGEFRILLTPSSNYGSIESQSYVTEISPLLITDGEGNEWYDYKGGREIGRFAPGDIALISTENCYTHELTPNMVYIDRKGSTTNSGINQTKCIGSTFFLDFVTKEGQKIARVEVPIEP